MTEYRTKMFARHAVFDELPAVTKRKGTVITDTDAVPFIFVRSRSHFESVLSYGKHHVAGDVLRVVVSRHHVLNEPPRPMMQLHWQRARTLTPARGHYHICC